MLIAFFTKFFEKKISNLSQTLIISWLQFIHPFYKFKIKSCCSQSKETFESRWKIFLKFFEPPAQLWVDESWFVFFSNLHKKISLALVDLTRNQRSCNTSGLAFIHDRSRASIKQKRAIHKSSSLVLVLLIRQRLVLKLSLHFKLVYWSRSLFHWFKSEHRYAFPTDWSVLTFYGRKRLSDGAQECEVSGNGRREIVSIDTFFHKRPRNSRTLPLFRQKIFSWM